MDRCDFPQYFPDNNVSLRSQHSLALVDNEETFTLEEVVERKHSPRMLLADRVKDDLIAALEANSPSGEVEQAIALLKAWDNTVAADTRGGALFEAWWNRYRSSSKTFVQEDLAVAWDESAPTTTPHGLADESRAVEAFHRAMRDAKEQYGGWDVTWGEVHRVRRGDAVDLPMSGGSGLMGCFRVAGFDLADDGKLVVNTGDSWVFAVEFSDPPRAYTVVGYSQSEVPGAEHFADQATLYSENRMKRAAFTEAEIKRDLERTYRP
jgi:acyl-homoserine-lactone acylase